MNDDQFIKLFKYMEERFDGVEKRLDSVEMNMATKDSIDHLISTVAAS